MCLSFPFFLQELGAVQKELQEELHGELHGDYDIIGEDSDDDFNDSENEDDILDDNTSIASAKRPGLRYLKFSNYMSI